MSKFNIVRTSAPLPKEEELKSIRYFLFECFTGFLDQDKKQWHKYWKKLFRSEPGELSSIETIFTRNYRFHKKYFALLNYAFDCWEPDRQRKSYKGMPVTKNFERFRSDVTIQAGFYEQTFDLDGNMKLEAQSISFAKMDDNDFEEVYNRVADVILQKVLITYKGREELDNVMNNILGFL